MDNCLIVKFSPPPAFVWLALRIGFTFLNSWKKIKRRISCISCENNKKFKFRCLSTKLYWNVATPICPVLSMTVFMIQWQSGVAVTESLSQSPKYLLAHITIILCTPVPKLLYQHIHDLLCLSLFPSWLILILIPHSHSKIFLLNPYLIITPGYTLLFPNSWHCLI